MINSKMPTPAQSSDSVSYQRVHCMTLKEGLCTYVVEKTGFDLNQAFHTELGSFVSLATSRTRQPTRF